MIVSVGQCKNSHKPGNNRMFAGTRSASYEVASQITKTKSCQQPLGQSGMGSLCRQCATAAELKN